MAEFSALDAQMMAKALSLAETGRFSTNPNPRVGCIILGEDGQIKGQGWHHRAGEPHAEVHALRQAGDAAMGGTCYVTLEPCSHYGRTPPCADALIKAGVRRVVAAMADPYPQVAGRGLKRMAQEGIEVQTGLLKTEAEQLNRGFIKRMLTGQPWITVKLASTLDGKIALANGESQWITSGAARADVQRHRAQSCAILSSANTVIADNASLTVRAQQLPPSVLETKARNQDPELRQPLRVIVDSRGRLTPDLALFEQGGDILQVIAGEVLNSDSSHQTLMLEKADRVDLQGLVSHLGERQCNEVWVEAGASLSGSLLQLGLVDELIFYQAPKLMGASAKSMLELGELTQMAEISEWDFVDVRRVGPDLKLTLQPNRA